MGWLGGLAGPTTGAGLAPPVPATAACPAGRGALPLISCARSLPGRLPRLQDTRRGSLGCGVFKEIPARQIPQCRLNALPQNYMLIQLTDPPAEAQAAAAAAAQQQQQHEPPGCVAEGGARAAPCPALPCTTLLLCGCACRRPRLAVPACGVSHAATLPCSAAAEAGSVVLQEARWRRQLWATRPQ